MYETVVDLASLTISNGLYGYMPLAKEWEDVVLFILMRGMSKHATGPG